MLRAITASCALSVAFGAPIVKDPPAAPVISGSGDWVYEFKEELVSLANTTEFGNDLNGHGVCKDTDGTIFFTFVPKKVSQTTQVLAKWSPDGTGVTLLGQPGPEFLSGGTPHGLRIEHDEKLDQSFLYHSNNNAKVIKTDLEGNIIWTADLSGWAKDPEMKQYTPIRPCDAIVVPGTDTLLVADGYGSSFVHAFDKNTGVYIPGKTFGGVGNTTSDPIKLHTPHGIALDPRHPGTVVISDRSNSRLVWTTFDGKYVRHNSTGAGAGMSLPCNVDVMYDEGGAGMVAIVPSLGGPGGMNNGSVGIYGPNDELLSTIEVAKEIGHMGHQHPHDAMFLPNGDAIVCCWSGPANTAPVQGPALGTISYWERKKKLGGYAGLGFAGLGN